MDRPIEHYLLIGIDLGLVSVGTLVLAEFVSPVLAAVYAVIGIGRSRLDWLAKDGAYG